MEKLVVILRIEHSRNVVIYNNSMLGSAFYTLIEEARSAGRLGPRFLACGGARPPAIEANRSENRLIIRNKRPLNYGNAVPDRDCTTEMSELLIKPLTVTSSR